MLLDLIYEKKNVITFSSYDKELDWKKYQFFNVWPKNENFYWRTESNKSEWLKVNSITPVIFKQIDVNYSRTFEKIKIQTSLDNVNWKTIYEGETIPPIQDQNFNEYCIFIRIFFQNVHNYVEVNKLHIYVEDKIEYDKRYVHHFYDLLYPSTFKFYHPIQTEITKTFLRMLEVNTGKKSCKVPEIEFNIDCGQFYFPPKIIDVRFSSNDLFVNSEYEIFVKTDQEDAEIILICDENSIVITRIDRDRFKMKTGSKSGNFVLKVIAQNHGLYTQKIIHFEVKE